MGIRVALHHRTSYRYDRFVALGPQVARLRPAPHCRTPVHSYSFKVQPAKHFINWQQDPHGNYLARLVFPDKTRELTLEVDLVAELTVINPFDFFLEPQATSYPFQYADWLATELSPYLQTLPVGPGLAKFLKEAPRAFERTNDFLVEINRLVQQRVKYLIRLEPGVQTCEQTLSLGSGSCRDSAWLLVQVMRNLGVAARFVSGYLIQLQPDVKPLEGPEGPKCDFTDLHAWAEVYLPGAGWVGLDPTSGLLAGEGHLPLAATPDPFSAAPITGGVDECETTFGFEMSVTRIEEAPRVTLPYTSDQWRRIETLGRAVDAELQKHDVRLTMGGEPTFVSIDDMEGAEWNLAAMGEHKRRLAGDLFNRLSKRFAQGPLMHFGQGKWYPGEPLPRWALGCYWRRDRQPIWNDADLIASDDGNYHHGEKEAHAFATALAQQLNVAAENIVPAYEDAWYYLWKERRLPVNVDPLKSNLHSPEDRARLAQVFERGLDRIVGYALPVRPLVDGEYPTRWQSGRWFFRSQHMFLIPGDSAMGLRLPLDSIPWVAPQDRVESHARDPFSTLAPLPLNALDGAQGWQTMAARTQNAVAARERVLVHQMAGVSPDGNGAGWASAFDEAPAAAIAPAPISPIVRTAVCVEPRDGILHVFLPPTSHLENYLELVAAVEQTSQRLGLPVRLEGYPPPFDPRLEHFKVTPDPGVIEVNVQPAASWNQLVELTTTLYEEARQARLGTEKFMLDGRHTGTGGGNHVVLGGPTPRESPFLRRPELLRSLITYWNNRPSLSYLFSGLFIGPTSQAPRVDEARHESVYELETAYTQLPTHGELPWVVDRVLRHLLVDLTGNTHRAEFCIDKLFSPDSSSGRLGLVELRAFEMPPHAHMSLSQLLLLRALVARFWTKPYRQELVRWGTALHDRFMLPHFVAQDFAEVLSEVSEAGFPFEPNWFDTHFEFRFPLLGQIERQGIQLELRQAIEPWNVLGEEPGAGGTARYVDSSLERVQIKVRGLTDSRHLVACNGRRVPLHPTGTPGEFVAGVRFRAWQPPSCLHPTIGVHAPLVLDIVDTWNERAVGGCTWHVAHPGGRAHDTFPVNALEAESRRVARFFATGHSPGPVAIPPREHNRDYPLTLDLRRPPSLATADG